MKRTFLSSVPAPLIKAHPPATPAEPARPLKLPALMALLLTLTAGAQAVSIVSGPSFTPAASAPLAGTLQLTTAQETRISVSVNDGAGVWERRFYDYSTAHSIPLAGFKPNRTNEITVTAYDRHRNEITAGSPVQFITSPLPTNFPIITVSHSEPARMEPGYTLLRADVKNGSYWWVAMLDSAGAVVWYAPALTTQIARQLPNGNLFLTWKTNFLEINLLGQTVNTWLVPTNLPIDPHEGMPTDHGTILYLSRTNKTITNYPSSMTVSNPALTTASVLYERVVEISATNAAVLNVWSPIDFLDPRRISYLNAKITGGWDSEHSNAIIEDPSDDSIIVSMRTQNIVFKFLRSTGQLKWILSDPANWGAPWQPYLLTPVGTPFGWTYGQHAPMLTPQGTLMVYDNGNFRASPFAAKVLDANNYSRAVEYSINEQTMEVTQVWDYGRVNAAQRLYTGRVGSAEPQPKTGNVLVDFGAVSYLNGVAPSQYGINATMARIIEVTHDAVPQVVFDVTLSLYSNTNTTYRDCSVYRCYRIPDLYAHPAEPVQDLAVIETNGMRHLEFSADNARTYQVEASSNLVHWESLGAAVEDAEQPGDYSYDDEVAPGDPARYYRVVTQ